MESEKYASQIPRTPSDCQYATLDVSDGHVPLPSPPVPFGDVYASAFTSRMERLYAHAGAGTDGCVHGGVDRVHAPPLSQDTVEQSAATVPFRR